MEIEIRYNEERNGIEIEFPGKPDKEILDQLRGHSFKWHRRGRYWYAGFSTARKEFVESLSDQTMDSEELKSIVLIPSYEPSSENVEQKRYSLVSIFYQDLMEKTRIEEFLVFETGRESAKEMGLQFGRKRHGENLVQVHAYPRNYIRKARGLFASGKIIRASDLNSEEGGGGEVSAAEPLVIEQIPEPEVELSPRQILNQQIEELIQRKDREGEAYLAADRELISKYTGSGGLSKQGQSDRGVLYEYYTPPELVRYLWALAHKFGYRGGPVLEPSCGIGSMFSYAPSGAELVGYETNPTSARIAQILYPGARIINRPFESIFFAGLVHLGDSFTSQSYDLVIGNPPYGEFRGRYAGLGEKRHTGATRYEEYFILRGLDLLAPGGLLIYIIPSSFLAKPASKFKKNKLSPRISQILDAYRLPVGTFTHTRIGTDILVLKKQ